jgi:serine/threonine protein kinase
LFHIVFFSYIDEEKRRTYLSWSKCYKIICGVAWGFLYLHDDCRLRVIHRDLKPENILLEADLNPKISDFGLASVSEGHSNQEHGT